MPEHRSQQRALGGQFPRAACHVVSQPGAVAIEVPIQPRQTVRHGVEAVPQFGDLVAAPHTHAAGEVPLGDDFGLAFEVLQGPQQPTRQRIAPNRRHAQRRKQHGIEQVQVDDRLPQHSFRERQCHHPSRPVRAGVCRAELHGHMGNDVVRRLDRSSLGAEQGGQGLVPELLGQRLHGLHRRARLMPRGPKQVVSGAVEQVGDTVARAHHLLQGVQQDLRMQVDDDQTAGSPVGSGNHCGHANDGALRHLDASEFLIQIERRHVEVASLARQRLTDVVPVGLVLQASGRHDVKLRPALFHANPFTPLCVEHPHLIDMRVQFGKPCEVAFDRRGALRPALVIVGVECIEQRSDARHVGKEAQFRRHLIEKQLNTCRARRNLLLQMRQRLRAQRTQGDRDADDAGDGHRKHCGEQKSQVDPPGQAGTTPAGRGGHREQRVGFVNHGGLQSVPEEQPPDRISDEAAARGESPSTLALVSQPIRNVGATQRQARCPAGLRRSTANRAGCPMRRRR